MQRPRVGLSAFISARGRGEERKGEKVSQEVWFGVKKQGGLQLEAKGIHSLENDRRGSLRT